MHGLFYLLARSKRRFSEKTPCETVESSQATRPSSLADRRVVPERAKSSIRVHSQLDTRML